MNELEASVINIKNVDDLNLVEFDFNGTILTMISLNLKDIFIGTKVKLVVNSNNIILAKNYNKNLSISNEIKAKIIEMEIGELLTSIKVSAFNNDFTAITTTQQAKQLDFQINDNVSVLVKASHFAIKKVIK